MNNFLGNSSHTSHTRRITFLGLMLAVILVLLEVERMLPPLPLFPPNFKLGLSNIMVMFAIFFVGVKDAFTLGVLKAGFNFLLRGYMGFALSLSGGMASIALIALFRRLFKQKISLLSLSIIGALAHNVAQLATASVLLSSPNLFRWYLPVLIVAGVFMGSVTGMAANHILPILKRIYQK